MACFRHLWAPRHVNPRIQDVKKVTSSHTKKQMVILAEKNIPEQELRSVVEKTGYHAISVCSEPYEKKGLFRR